MVPIKHYSPPPFIRGVVGDSHWEAEVAKLRKDINTNRELFIRNEMMRMRVNRLGCELLIFDSGWKRDDSGAYRWEERLALRRLLPPGPRPLP